MLSTFKIRNENLKPVQRKTGASVGVLEDNRVDTKSQSDFTNESKEHNNKQGEAGVLKSEVSTLFSEMSIIEKDENSGSTDSNKVVQRVLSVKQATGLLRRLSRLSMRWRRLFMDVVNMVRAQGIGVDVLTQGIRDLHEINPVLAGQLSDIERELTRLANDMNSLAGDIIRNTVGAGEASSDSDDDSNPLERARETIYMNCRDEIDE